MQEVFEHQHTRVGLASQTRLARVLVLKHFLHKPPL